MALRDYYRCKKCDAKVVYGPDRREEDWEPFLLCRDCIAKLEAENQSAGEEIRELREQVERLTRPVTDEEWAAVPSESGRVKTAYRDEVNRIIRARSTEQPLIVNCLGIGKGCDSQYTEEQSK